MYKIQYWNVYYGMQQWWKLYHIKDKVQVTKEDEKIENERNNFMCKTLWQHIYHIKYDAKILHGIWQQFYA